MTKDTAKVALITGCGAGRGIGRAIAERYASEGIHLLLSDLSVDSDIPGPDQQNKLVMLTHFAERLRVDYRVNVDVLELDVTIAERVDEAVSRAVTSFGRLDILVNNAAAPASLDRAPVVELTETAWDGVMAVNLKGAFLCSKYAAKAMVKHGIRGRIINIGSSSSKVGMANKAAYCASKFGLIGLTQSMAIELGPYGITVNALCPAMVDTDRLRALSVTETGKLDMEAHGRLVGARAKAIPLGRIGTPEDVAGVAAFLVSDAGSYITGQSINIAGGLIMH